MKTIAEFAAERADDQLAMEKDLFPDVSEALQVYPATNWYADLLAEVTRIYVDTYHRAGGAGRPSGVEQFVRDVRDTLDKTEDPTDATVDRISVWLATAILNAATQEAVGSVETAAVMEWVTMKDSAVRDDHVNAGGQRRPVGEPFLVGGYEMRYPGDPTVPIELWINCRCALAPVGSVTAAAYAERPGIGGYPIDNCEDLKNAIQAIGRARPEDRAKTIAHIKTQKKRLGCPEVELPDTEGWAIEEEETMTAAETETMEAVPDMPLAWHGVLAPEGVWSGDGRQFAPDSLRFRELPLPLTWQKTTDSGHDGSVVVAKITSIERVDGMMRASGTFLQTPEADEVVGLLAEFGKFGVSVDADDAEFEFSETDERITFTSARIASASIVSIPAFAEAYVALGEWETEAAMDDNMEEDEPDCDPNSPNYDPVKCEQYAGKVVTLADLAPGRTEDGPGWLTHPVDTDRLRDYWTQGAGAAKIAWGTDGDFNRCRANLAEYIKPQYLNGYCANRHFDALGYWPGQHSGNANAFGGMFTTWTPGTISTQPIYVGGGGSGGSVTLVAAGVKKAPAAWFANPGLTAPTHLTVTEEGRVFGHIAEWSACHIGYDGVCVAPPPSRSDYAYFATGQVLLDDGSAAKTGVISLGGGHARDGLRPIAAISHYDSTSAGVCDVAVGEDEHGIWCAGWVRPGTTEEQTIALRASDVSGDWREIRGELELVAALAVNVGGFPTVSVGVQDGMQVSLVAAGAVRTSPEEDVIEALAERIEGALVARATRRERMQELAARWERRNRMKELAARVGGSD